MGKLIGGLFMKTKDLIICALFAALTGVLAQIAIPLPGGVPLTMQTLAVSLAGVLLGAKRGFVATLVYVLMGAVGLPVFANLTGGAAILFGKTGGFILSFPIMAYVIGVISEKTEKKVLVFLGMVLGSIVNYALGMVQFSVVTGLSLYMAFIYCVLPFIVVGLLKSVLATALGFVLKNHKGLRGVLSYDKA